MKLDTSKSKEQLLELRSKKAKNARIKTFFGVILLLVSIAALLVVVGKYRKPSSASAPWMIEFEDALEPQRISLSHYGLPLERMLFDFFTVKILEGSSYIVGEGGNTTIDEIVIRVSLFTLKCLYGVLISVRLLLIFGIVGGVFGYYRMRAYTGKDLLGVSGNGRRFFSGIKASLSDIQDEYPKIKIPGLTSLSVVSDQEFNSSSIKKILVKNNALTKTSEFLAKVILFYKEVPHFTETPKISLIEGTVMDLESIFDSHSTPLKEALLRVITPSQKKLIDSVSSSVKAALILAIQAGKVLSFEKEMGVWMKKSLFPQLSARAVLHSSPDFPDDFSSEECAQMRRALIYASRVSVLGPVRFPVDLDSVTAALRSWSEVLFTAPTNFSDNLDEIELYSYLYTAQESFREAFARSLINMEPFLVDDVIATDSIVFFKVQGLLHLYRKAVTNTERQKISDLSEKIGRASQDQIVSKANVSEAKESVHRSNIVIPPPLSLRAISDLSHFHEVSSHEIQEWAGLRTLLLSFGWLSRRVGETLLGDASIIYGIFSTKDVTLRPNSLGLFMRKGVVPIRSSRLEEVLDESWTSRFMIVDSAEGAESREVAEKMLAGTFNQILEQEGD